MERRRLEAMVQRSMEVKSMPTKTRTTTKSLKWQQYALWTTMPEQPTDTLIACTRFAATKDGG